MATQQADHGPGLKESVNVLKILADAHAACLVPFLRTRFGTEGIGVSGVLALVMIPLYGALSRAPGMFVFFWVWLAAVACQRIKTLRLVRAGWWEHSRYTGWPWVAFRLVPGVRSERAAKCVVEPVLCLVAGAVLCAWSEAVGQFVMLGFFSILIGTAIDVQVERMRLRQMRDAEIETRQLAGWHRRGGMDN